MKALILHGPAINISRKKLTEIKQAFDQSSIITFEERSNIADIQASFQTVSMFSGERLVIIENPPEELFSNLSLVASHLSLVFWFDHEVKKLPDGIQALFFPEEKEASIFPFLEALGNRDIKAYLELEKRNRTSPNDTQYILTMVFYLLRSLVVTPIGAKDFVKNKNARMRKNFSEDEVLNLYKFVIETDFKIKSGLLEPSHAEFLLVNRFAPATG